MKKIIATLAAFVFSISSAYAVAISDLSLGVSANQGVYIGDGKEENYTHTGTLELTTEKHGQAFEDAYPSIFVEYNANDNVAIGLSYVFESIETPQHINDGEGGDNQTDIKVSAKFDDLMSLYVLGKTDFGIYGKVGVSQMDIQISSENAGTYPNPGNTNGWEVAFGYEHEAGNGMAIRAELAYHEFDSVKANNGQTDKNEITVSNMYGATGRLSLVKSF